MRVMLSATNPSDSSCGEDYFATGGTGSLGLSQPDGGSTLILGDVDAGVVFGVLKDDQSASFSPQAFVGSDGQPYTYTIVGNFKIPSSGPITFEGTYAVEDVNNTCAVPDPMQWTRLSN